MKEPKFITLKAWKEMELGDVSQIIMGQSPDSSFVNEVGEGIAFLQGCAEFGQKYPIPLYSVTQPTKIVNKGDILTSVRAPVGEMNLSDRSYCIGRGLAGVRFHDSVDSIFGWYALSHFKNQLDRVAQGSTFLAISSHDIRSLNIRFPSEINEQRSIAEILTKVDDAIEQTEALIRKYQRIKQGLMQDLLTRGVDENGEVRNPYKNREGFRKTSFGYFPKVWKVAPLEEILSNGKGHIQTGPFGTQVHVSDYVPEGIPMVMPQNIDNMGFIETINIPCISQQKAFELVHHKLFENDVIFARRGDLSKCANITEREQGWLCGTGSMLVRIDEKILNGKWLTYYYRHDLGQRQILSQAVGSTMKSINTELLSGMIIACPTIEEQKRIISILNNQDELVEKEKNYLSKLTLLKQGLMQDLLTGKVRM